MPRLTPEDLHRDARKRVAGGKQVKAPCGHNGEHVFPGYVRCIDGCEGDPAPQDKKPECLHQDTGWFSSGRNCKVRVCLDCHKQYDPNWGNWYDPV